MKLRFNNFCEKNCVRYSGHGIIRELNQPRRRRQQERYKFAYLTRKHNRFARLARAFFIIRHFADVLVLSTTRNDLRLFCSCVDDVSIRSQISVQFCLLTPVSMLFTKVEYDILKNNERLKLRYNKIAKFYENKCVRPSFKRGYIIRLFIIIEAVVEII